MRPPGAKWLTRLTSRYLAAWPDMDFDMCTAFRFDGVVALLGHEIDLLVTPDPIVSPDVLFEPVTDYELMLVEHEAHPLAARAHVKPQDLLDEELIAVPVSIDRLDIYTRFLGPAHCTPRSHRTAESTDLMLQLVAAGRGVAVLPDWLVREDRAGLPVRDIRLGKHGIDKSINVGGRRGEESIAYVAGFVALAQEMGGNVARKYRCSIETFRAIAFARALVSFRAC